MEMSFSDTPYRLARLPGQQGARLSAGNQAEDEKLTTGKRNRTLSDEFEDRFWNRYLVLSGSDDRFKSVSAIAISNAIEQVIGTPEEIRRMNDGSILIKVGNRRQSEKLHNIKLIAGTSVTIQAHRTLNSCKGTVISRESHRCTDQELKDWLAIRHVTDVKRIILRQKHLQLLILTFKGDHLPDKIPVGFEWCRVRPYIPNPMRCFCCQKYGHMNKTCRNAERCATCGSYEHFHTKEKPCVEPPKCVNCGEDHAAYDRRCAKWILEKEVQKLKVEKAISFPQARHLAEQTKGPVTYAAVTALSPSPRRTPHKKIQLDTSHKYSKNSSPRHQNSKNTSTRTDHFQVLFQEMNLRKNLTFVAQTADKPKGMSESQESDSDSMEVTTQDSIGITDSNPGVAVTDSGPSVAVTDGNPSVAVKKGPPESTRQGKPSQSLKSKAAISNQTKIAKEKKPLNRGFEDKRK